MRTTLGILCSFTVLASLWLFTMFLILRHPGFEWRAAVALGFAAISTITLVAVRTTQPAPVLRGVAATGGAVLLAMGVHALISNHAPGADFEGYLDIIGLAYTLQGSLTLWWAAGHLRKPRLATS